MKNDDRENPNIQNIFIKIRIDKAKGEFGHNINVYGYNNNKPILDALEFIGILEVIKQEELKKLFKEAYEETKID